MTPTITKMEWWVGAHKILEIAQSPNSFFPFPFDFGFGTWTWAGQFSLL